MRHVRSRRARGLVLSLTLVGGLGSGSACSSDDAGGDAGGTTDPGTDGGASDETGGDGGSGTGDDGTGGTGGDDGTTEGPDPGDTTVHPTAIDDVLVNPGMGLANFHFAWMCNLPPVTFTPEECADRVLGVWPENHPQTGTAYFRWLWREIETTPGEIDFDMIDTAIQSANVLGETLSFRIMTIHEGGTGLPQWIADQVSGEWRASGAADTFWPDYRDEVLQTEHARMVAALGARYDDHPGVDHVDIGSVGCWGEWNTACLTDGDAGIVDVYDPADDQERAEIAAAFEQLIDGYVDAFEVTPTVMLGIGSGGGYELDVFVHAIAGGTGWRVDCWGDWGIFGPDWNHHENLYPNLIANATDAHADFASTWQRAPIQLEVCATMPAWHDDHGWSADAPDGEVHRTFEWAVEQHASVLNAKFTAIPAAYVSALDDLLRRNGYRLVIDRFNHPSSVAAGAELTFVSGWSNLGVAPSYIRRTLAYRLRSASEQRVFESEEDIRTWLPGSRDVTDTFTVPADLAADTYQIEVAILDRDGTEPETIALPPLQLGIEGRGDDGWYAISQLTVE